MTYNLLLYFLQFLINRNLLYYENILSTIGNTPLVKLNKVVEGVKATVLAKIETFNPGNSIKDRMALKMVEDAEKAGILKPGGTIIEGTSGNTGMGTAPASRVVRRTGARRCREDRARAFPRGSSRRRS